MLLKKQSQILKKPNNSFLRSHKATVYEARRSFLRTQARLLKNLNLVSKVFIKGGIGLGTGPVEGSSSYGRRQTMTDDDGRIQTTTDEYGRRTTTIDNC